MCARIIILIISIVFLEGCGGGKNSPPNGEGWAVEDTNRCVFHVVSNDRILEMKKTYESYYNLNLNKCGDCKEFQRQAIKGFSINQVLNDKLTADEYLKVSMNIHYLKSIIYMFETDKVTNKDLSKISCEEVN
jgi:hypothetical protein